MRIAILTDVYKICGVSREIYQISEYCRKNKIQLKIFMQKPKRRIKVIKKINSDENVKVIEIKAKNSLEIYPDIFISFDPNIMKTLNEEFEKTKFDLIILPTIGLFGLRGLKISKKFKVPVILIYNTQLHDYWSLYLKKVIKTDIFDDISRKIVWNIMKHFFENSSLILVKNKYIKDELSKEIEKPIVVFPSGIDTKEFSPKFRKKHKKIRLIYVGRLAEEKNLDFLVNILNNEILPKYKNIEIWIVGDGPKKKYMKKKLKAKYTGFLTGRKLSEVFSSGDIFLFPSKTETFGSVVLEAMASGLPVVAFDSIGPKQIINNGETGFLCVSEEEFIERTKFLIENPDIRKKIGMAAFEEAKKYDWEKIIEKVIIEIKNILNLN